MKSMRLASFAFVVVILGLWSCDDPGLPTEDDAGDTGGNNGADGGGVACDDEDCDDGVPCTIDSCGPGGSCLHQPDDSVCDDGVACTNDRCFGFVGCINQTDDSVCGDTEVCDREAGCREVPSCDRAGDPRCDDGQACTTDSCNVATGRCEYELDDAQCDDGAFCNGTERCAPFAGCVIDSFPSCDDGVVCTIDQCNEDDDSCDHFPAQALCDDGLFCNGVEVCDPSSGCQTGTAPTCEDNNPCTIDTCDDTIGACVNAIIDDDGDGDGDIACGGLDCDDGDPDRSSLADEICNDIDEDCDGIVDEGVQSPCGNCDSTCEAETVGGDEGADFTMMGQIGTEFDQELGGLVISAETRDEDFLWVVNTNESSMSRWDAENVVEVGRYKVGLPAGECLGRCCHEVGCNMPSRIAVDGRGDAYVANRGFGMQGTLTKVAGDISRCVDRNDDMDITTSTDSTAMPFDTDECLLYTAPVGTSDALLRALAIDLGDAAHPEGYPWVGGFNVDKWWKIDPDDGSMLAEVDVPVSPYGGIVTADGKLWIGTLDERAISWIDTETMEVGPRIDYPAIRGSCANSYGITADTLGRIWLAGWTCNDALGYDPANGQWVWVDTRLWNFATGRGITIDPLGRIWMALSPSQGMGQSHVAVWDSTDFSPGGVIGANDIQVLQLPAGLNGPSGVGADNAGNIWVAHWISSELVRIDPETLDMQSYAGPDRVYTYSDFTGSVRRTIVGRGNYQQDFDAGCDDPQWDEVSWQVLLPDDASVSFAAATASDAAGLDAAQVVPVAEDPSDVSPASIGTALDTAVITHGRHLRVSTTLEASRTNLSPVLQSYRVSWRCP